MSDDDEIGEKSDMTRIEDLSEFLHQDDPDVDAAFSEDEPPTTENLPSLNDLDDEDTEFESNLEEEEEFNPSFDSEEDTQTDFTLSDESDDDSDILEDSTEDEDEFDSSEESSDFVTTDEDEETSFSDDDNSNLSFDTENSEDENSFETNEDENDFSSSNDFDSEMDFSDDDDDQEEDSESLFESNDMEEVIQEEEEQSFIPPAPAPTQTYIDKSEKFEDIKSFAKNITYGKISSGGNPPFSIILRNIKFEEDVEDILIILNEHELVSPETEATMKQSLEGGSLLISQISEYAAIYLTHKFRRFNLDIQMGLSDELHPSKSYESDSVGLISKARINQNKNETTRINKSKVDLEAIIISTTPTLENYKIIEYLGIVSDFIIVDEEELTNDQDPSEYHERSAKGHVDHEETEIESDIDLKISQSAIYSDLSEKLKPICLKKNANAVVGINYQITPLSDGSKYKISCSGSAVWIIDNN